MKLFIAILYGLLGTAVGSFLNVCILRIPQGRSFITGRSSCPFCQRQLMARDMVPILSWIRLGGRCRFCRSPISFQYPAVEALTGLVYFLCCLAKGPGKEAAILCIFGSIMIFAAWIDARYLYIPDTVHLLILLLSACSAACSVGPGLQSRIAGFILCGGFLALLSFLTKGGVGGGDVKLLSAGGFLLGAGRGMTAILLAYAAAGMWYFIPLIRKKVDGKTQAPMVPFFAFSLMLCGLWYDRLICWYIGLFIG